MRLAIVAVLLLVLAFLGAIVAWFAAGPVIAFASRSVDVTGDPEVDLPGLLERSVVRAADGTPLAVLADEFDREVVELDRIPNHVQHAVIAAEDRRFYAHEGYDVNAIWRAAFANLLAGGVEQGASTISQQLAQTNFLGGEETIRRKLEEVSVARALEDAYTKDELLEHYLNQVYFGAGAYGVQAGAQEFFGVLVEDLDVGQAALLAGVIRSPTSLDPRRNPGGAKSRRDIVLRAMVDEGYLDRRDAEQMIAAPVDVVPPREPSSDAPYVVEAVKREFFNNSSFGETVDDRIHLLFTGGLEVKTTVQPALQEAADEIVSAAFPRSGGPTAAIVAVDPVTGGVMASHGGKDFDEVQFDLAMQGRRQPGSALKPLTAASAMEEGIPPTIRLGGNGPVSLDVPGAIEPFEVDNFGGSDHGTVDLRGALVNSVNTAFAELILRSGVEETIELGGRLGINVERAFGPEDTWGPAIVLGGLTHGVTPLEMASLFSAFANEGIHSQPYLIESVTDGSGEVLYEREPVAEQVLDPAVAAAMVDMLQDVVAHGTGTGAQLPGLEPIGKTGTNTDGADAWFVGGVPIMATAVWVGHAEGQVPMPDMTGGSLPADLWQQFMTRALEDVDVPPFADDTTDLDALPTPAPEDDEEDAPGTDPGPQVTPRTPDPNFQPAPAPPRTHSPRPRPPPTTPSPRPPRPSPTLSPSPTPSPWPTPSPTPPPGGEGDTEQFGNGPARDGPPGQDGRNPDR